MYIYIYTTYILLCNTAHLVEWFAIESGDFQRVAMFSNSINTWINISIRDRQHQSIARIFRRFDLDIPISFRWMWLNAMAIWPAQHGWHPKWTLYHCGTFDPFGLFLLNIYILLCFASSFLFCKKPLACFGKTETITSPGFKIQCFEGGSKVRDIYDGNRVFERCWWDQAHI